MCCAVLCCVCVCVRVRACVRECVRAWVRACVCIETWVASSHCFYRFPLDGHILVFQQAGVVYILSLYTAKLYFYVRGLHFINISASLLLLRRFCRDRKLTVLSLELPRQRHYRMIKIQTWARWFIDRREEWRALLGSSQLQSRRRHSSQGSINTLSKFCATSIDFVVFSMVQPNRRHSWIEPHLTRSAAC